ncbi:phosphonate ABC transporter, permease protein PhnE [Aquibium carbonis]|uniref:Phosphonate ABC transporter, permease protein PhnE n=1 Tax=Aquibium carbonis TaxID=2495581 RepID=A0A429YZI0_9HYPH|nr:phosphonate ABC transporter, permease protein PhnE [Aquibium carbonis]RST86804.1 phosphonate ABC transporter, permease protein PhnE [Aquibium carbonis]
MAVADIGYDPARTRATAVGLFRRKRLVAFGVPAIILAYFVYVFFAFDIPGLAERARMDNARILLADTYSHKVHVSQDNRSGETSVAIEGENKGKYADDAWPDWVQRDGQSVVVELGGGEIVRFDPGAVRYDVPGYGLVSIRRTDDGIVLDTPQGPLPDWINASNTRVSINRAAGRVSVTRNRTEALRYFAGWELFFFTLDSPFAGKSWGELASLAVSGDQVRPGQSNIGAMASDFWNNEMWRHKDVVWAIFETVLMAFLGTMGAMLVAFPLAFAAAINFSPSFLVRFGIRRLFDFLRGVDGLIWTIILSRAFGPGPLTGSLAILLTDTGSFGKLFSEALENVDNKQIDGLRSTGANAIQRNRFGVIPQVAPVILSQVLYYLESNTRSATIIGAIVGGGIGLLLTQAIQTQKDWEEVSYYIILTLLMVSTMDIVSGWLRQKLIGRTTNPAAL